jgi:glycosyltransferase involved in cell wall biosynthesis
MPDPDLSICIATYNRSRYIGATLDGILPQLGPRTEVVIVDGASTDDTSTIVSGYQQRDARIRYHRQAVNGGVDRDFAAAVELARGRYCWLFTDDDFLKPHAVTRVLARVDEGHSLVIVNAEVCNADMSAVLEPNRVGMMKDRVYHVGDDDRLFADTAVYLSFIGAVVIERAFWQSRAKEPYIGSEFIHFGVIFQAPLPSTALVIAEPLVQIRYGNAMWTARGFEIWMFRWPALVWSMPRAEASKRAIAARERWRNPLMLLGHRAIGAYSVAEYERLIAPRKPPLPSRLAARAIAKLPGRAVNAFARFVLALLPKSVLPLFAADLHTSRFYGRRQ